MRICITTSNAYHHCLPIFFRQYAKHWDEPFDLIGYKKPEIELPKNCTWVSMGEQGPVTEWSTDLRKYFEALPDKWFIWGLEDCFLRSVNREGLEKLKGMCHPDIGRINLTKEAIKQEHFILDEFLAENTQTAFYRTSTQFSIWNKDFLMQHLLPGLSPWDFESNFPKNDGWRIIGPRTNIVHNNEGVRRFNISELNLDGIE